MTNLGAVLAAAGAKWGDVVKTTVFLHDMSDFPVVNEVYGRILGDARPARSTVQVSALPRNVLVEIDAVVAVPSAVIHSNPRFPCPTPATSCSD